MLVESFFSLSLLSGLNVILPLITLPYLLRTVGPANYGVYAYITVLVQYCLLVNTYGFNFSATKQVSQFRNNKNELSRIYSSVIVSRLILAAFTFILLFIFSLIFISSKTELLMLLWGAGIVIGDTFIPVWLFQGVEKMRYLTIVNLVAKVVFTIFIFLFIRESNDYKYIIILNSLGYLTAGFFSTIISSKIFSVKFIKPSLKELLFQFKEGFALFGSTVGIELYRNANIFLLRFYVDDNAVGIYAAAEKVIKGIQMVTAPIVQAFFPHLSLKFENQSLRMNLAILLRIVLYFSPIVLIISVSTFVFAPTLSSLLCGDLYNSAISLIKIMSPVLFIGGINYVIGILGLVNLNMQNSFFKSVLISGIVSVLFVIFTVNMFGNASAAWAMTISEIILFLSCTFYILKSLKK